MTQGARFEPKRLARRRLAPGPCRAAGASAAHGAGRSDARRRGCRAAAATLRVWGWAGAAVVMGRCHALRNEVDAQAARRHGIEVVRRISGGGAMFIEPGNTITYSITAPMTLVEDMTFEQAYAFMDQWVIEALGGLGIKAWYQPLNDITSSAGKIAGAAQTRRRGAVLHHVTMAYDIDAVRMLEVLRIGRAELAGTGRAAGGE